MKKITFILRLSGICLLCGLVFILSGYFYLKKNIKVEKAENKTTSIPYTAPAPDNAGILLELAGNKSFLFLDFERDKVSVLLLEDDDTKDKLQQYGYDADYSVSAGEEFIADMIDFTGGINLTAEGETYRYTGVQVVDLLTKTPVDREVRKDVLTAFFHEIAESGLEKKAFLYLIENSETNLTVPDCYSWADKIQSVCRHAEFIN